MPRALMEAGPLHGAADGCGLHAYHLNGVDDSVGKSLPPVQDFPVRGGARSVPLAGIRKECWAMYGLGWFLKVGPDSLA